MKRSRRSLLSKGAATGILVLAIGLLAFAGIGTARAALASHSKTFIADLHTATLSVELVENCEIKEETNLLIGKKYKDILGVKNTSKVPEYVRVTICKYWTNKDGIKCTVDPKLIDLNFVGKDSVWAEDLNARTDERTVLYCKKVVPAGKAVQFADTIRIDKGVASGEQITQLPKEDNKTEIVTTYDYNNITYHIDIEVDAVQEHNAAAAIKSSWGIDASALGIVIDPKK